MTAKRLLCFVFFPVCLASNAGITFTPGDYYGANFNFMLRNIVQYNPAGDVVGSLTFDRSLGFVRGMAFGPDGLLYATISGGSGFTVLALDSLGTVQQTYPMSSIYIGGNLSYGKIAVDGQHIYVAGAGYVTKFDVGNPASGTAIYGNKEFFDVDILPGGNLLVASNREVEEITPTGTFVRTVAGDYIGHVHGVEYDQISNNLFVTHLGPLGNTHALMRIDGTTGLLEESITFNYADDIFLTASGDLLVGSRTEAPHLFTQDLDVIGWLGSEPQMFVTQLIPEPSCFALCTLGCFGLLFHHRARSKAV